MKTQIKTITVDRETNEIIKQGFKEVELDYDPWDELCRVLADEFINLRKESKND